MTDTIPELLETLKDDAFQHSRELFPLAYKKNVPPHEQEAAKEQNAAREAFKILLAHRLIEEVAATKEEGIKVLSQLRSDILKKANFSENAKTTLKMLEDLEPSSKIAAKECMALSKQSHRTKGD